MTTKKKKKEYWHKQSFYMNVDMFSTDIVVFVNKSGDEIKNELKRLAPNKYEHFDESSLDHWDEGLVTNGMMVPFTGGFVVFLKLEKDSFRESVSLITHEMTHVTQYLLRNRGIELSTETEEIHAYLVENLVYQTLINIYD